MVESNDDIRLIILQMEILTCLYKFRIQQFYFRVYGNETMHGNVSFTHASSGQGKLNKP